jgi:hypothetical protein
MQLCKTTMARDNFNMILLTFNINYESLQGTVDTVATRPKFQYKQGYLTKS